MSTPNEGPDAGRPQGLSPEALRALGTMTPAQQQAMNHVVNAVKAVAPMINAVAKCIRGIRNTFARLSQAAQRLSSTDRALNSSQGGRHRAESSPTLSMPTREQLVQARDRGRSLARDAGMALVNGAGNAAKAVGRWAWSKGQNVKAAVGEQVTKQVVRGQMWANDKVMPLVQAADAKVSQAQDWAGGKLNEATAYGNQQMSRAAARASAALAAFAVNRSDPTLTSPDQKLSSPAQLQAFSKAIEALTVPEDQRAAKLAEFVDLAEKLNVAPGADLEKAGAPAVEGGGRTAAAAHHELWNTLHAGQAPANTMSKPNKTGQATTSAKEQAPGAHTKKEGPSPQTPTRD